jgi:hypothetical protein
MECCNLLERLNDIYSFVNDDEGDMMMMIMIMIMMMMMKYLNQTYWALGT